MSEIMIKKKEDGRISHKKEHKDFEYTRFEITPRHKENDVYVAIYEIPPLKKAYPYHYHLNSCEVFYIISGEGILRTSLKDKRICKGDVIVCPKDEAGAHQIINTSTNETLVYLDMDTVPTTDVVIYPDSKKIGVIQTAKSSTFFKERDQVEYYQDE